MTSVFLTGASGNVGRPVARELLDRGYSVMALVRSLPGRDGNSPGVINLETGCCPVFGSLEEIGRISREVSKADAIVHLACARSNSAETVMQQDIMGTAQIAEAWSKGNFVYMSSQTVYGIPLGDLTEDAPLDPFCWYDLGKVCNEFQLNMAPKIPERGAAVSLRMALLFGPGRARIAPQYLEIIYDECLRGSSFVFESEEGLETYGSSFIGERDLARAVVDSLSIETSGPLNVAGGYCTWRSLIETIDRLAGTQTSFRIRAGAVAEQGEYRLPQSRSFVDAGAFVTQTGFVAEQPLEELIENFVRAHRARAA